MLKVVIIDDEFFLREALKKTIPWNMIGFDFVGEADDGETGYDLIVEQKPDIAIVDINMSKMNGLELIKKLRQNGIDTNIIILSGYDDFEYAKRAIKLNVHSYILKPVNEKELVLELEALKREIESNYEQINLIEESEKNYKESQKLYKDKFINQIVNFQVELNEHLESKLHQNKIFIGKYYKTIVINYISKNLSEIGRKEDEYDYILTSSEQNFEDINIIVWNISDSDYGVIVSHEDENRIDKQNITRATTALLQNLSKLGEFNIGVSDLQKDITSISISYVQALYCIYLNFNDNKSSIVFYEDIDLKRILMAYQFSQEDEHHLIYSFRTNNKALYEQTVRDIFQNLADKKVSKAVFENVSFQILQLLYRHLNEHPKSANKFMKEYANIGLVIKSFNGYDGLRDWIIKVIGKSLEGIEVKRTSVTDILIGEIKQYVYENSHNSDFNIDQICKNFNFNYYYICKTFKSKTQKTLGNYILETRMKKARQFIEEGIRNIDKLADYVGYKDTNYFSKSFKKYFGVTPKKLIYTIREER